MTSDKGNGAGGFAALTGIGLAVGAAAFGAFLSSRHRGDEDDAPLRTKRDHDGPYAVVGRTVTIRKERSELYSFWRDFSNLAAFMENLEKIEKQDGDRSVWTIKAPAGTTVDLVTEVSRDEKDKEIAWRSVEGSDIETYGRVTFEDAPGERGTRVALDIHYKPPAGKAGRAIAKLFLREPQTQARHDLKRFKMLMETGEITTSARTADQSRAAKQENGR
ncbi:SRPBCC family protein [Qipengyuania sp. MTN3-11]|uniref:SRPBCC family protein n=1 Tax=Qipengyuania sp. MTN3-11 TaxID=3056557 RepID=UPI0036F3241E